MTTIKGITIGQKLSVNFMTNMQKLHRGIWPWTKGLKSRLPLHYKIRYVETWMKEPTPVHYRADTRKWVANEDGVPVRVQNVPIPVLFPREADQGLWGGEGIVAGFKKKHNKELKVRSAAIWKPFLTRRVFHSEILDTFYDVTVTLRTLDLIDENFGFDFYILKTHEVDLKSKFGMTLKREMLIALAKRSFHPNNLEKQEQIYEKYKQFAIPLEEAEWVGLTLQEAERKQHQVEEEERIRETKPMRQLYANELIEELKRDEGSDEGSISWLKKLSPFKS